MVGFNFATETEKWKNNGSVNFNLKNSDIRSKTASETFVSSTSSSFTNAKNMQDNRNLNLTADFRIEWNPDTTTMVLFRPRFQYGDTDNETKSNTYTFNQDPVFSTDELIEADEQDRLTELTSLMYETLCSVRDIKIAGEYNATRHLPLFSITSDRIDPSLLCFEMNRRYGIESRVGVHCAPLAIKALGVPEGTVRLSAGPFTTDEEISLLRTALEEVMSEIH